MEVAYKDEVRVWVELGRDVIRHCSSIGMIVNRGCNAEQDPKYCVSLVDGVNIVDPYAISVRA